VRERIRIDNQPLSETQFAKYFFETWDRLEASAKAANHPDPSSVETKPVYFRFLTLMAFHCYISEGVNAAVIECGIGGEYDSTNILVKPRITAVTSLGIDHTAMLGETIESIAWHKAGIFKSGVPAFSAPQSDSAVKVLEERAAEKQTTLQVVSRDPDIEQIQLGLAADFQKTNASLAVAVAAAFIRSRDGSTGNIPKDGLKSLPDSFRIGLEQAQLGGRCETRRDTKSNLTWYIDGGHTLESIEMAGRWFASLIASPSTRGSLTRILIFNQQTRDANALAKKLHSTLSSAVTSSSTQPFSHVIFCTNTTYSQTGYRPDLTSINTNAADVQALSVQNALADTWKEVDPSAKVEVVRTIEEAIGMARVISGSASTSESPKALVTGSLHLVGGLIEVLESEAEATDPK